MDGRTANASHQRPDARVRMQREQCRRFHDVEERASRGAGKTPATRSGEERRRCESDRHRAYGRQVRRRFAVGVVIFALAFSICASWRAQAQQARTVKDGVYTAAQAKRGETIYQMQCVACHGATLEGLTGPPLTGPSFLADFSNVPVSDLLEKIRNTMPADSPGTLGAPQVADVIAYLFQSNRFSSGSADLPSETAALKLVSLPASSAAAAT